MKTTIIGISMIDIYDYSKLWYYVEWHVNMWHWVWRGSRLCHKSNKHIPPHHFMPVARRKNIQFGSTITNRLNNEGSDEKHMCSDSESNHIVTLLFIFPGEWEGVWYSSDYTMTVDMKITYATMTVCLPLILVIGYGWLEALLDPVVLVWA